MEPRPGPGQSEDGLDAGALHPGRRSGVPGPAAAPHVSWRGVDIRSHDIGLDLVAVQVGAGARVIDRIEQGKQGRRLVAFAQAGQGHHRPHGGVGVLSAIFAQARRVTFDVSRIEGCAIERWCKQQGQPLVRQYEFALNRRHGRRGAVRLGDAGKHRPRLGDGIDAALLIARRTHRRAVVEPGAPVPVAVPRFTFQGDVERRHMPAPTGGPGPLPPAVGEVRKSAQGRVQQPPQPDTLAAPAFADAVHTVVPIAAAHQWQAVHADRQTVVQGAGAVLVERGGFLRKGGLEEGVVLTRLQHLSGKEGDDFVQNRLVADHADIVGRGVGQPGPVVGDAGAHALSGVRQPPVLDVAFDKLSPGGAQEMLAREGGSDRGQGHAVLQLIAKSVGAAGLVKARARPDAAGERLVGEPPVKHDIHGTIRGLHLNPADGLLPKSAHFGQHLSQIDRSVTRHQGQGFGFVHSVAQKDIQLGDAVRGDLDDGLEGAARVQP